MINNKYKPLEQKERVEILDLLRGIALLGIFMVNMPLMNSPFLTEMGAFSLWTDSINKGAEWIIKFFFTGKFYTMFSMLFGIGFYFFLRKADEAEKSTLPLFRRRLGWLLAIGVLHVVLLWYGDILVFYALFGFLLILFRKKSNRTLIIWAIFFMLLPVIFAAIFSSLIQFALSAPDVGEQMAASFAEAQERMQEIFDRALVVYASGSYSEIVSMRLEEYKNVLGWILFFFPGVLAMFLVGFVLARKKVFEDLEKNRDFFIKLLLFSLPFALAGNWMYAHYSQTSSYITFDWDMPLALLGHAVGGPAMSFVYIALVVHCKSRGYFSFITNAIAKTGRMALTNYLLQSIIATTLFFSYGFGLYGQVTIVQGMMLVVSIYIVQVIGSHFWLKHYRFGPMEWLWRTLTYGKKQKMKITEN